MIGMYLGTVLFLIGAFITLVVNRNIKVSMSDDFWDLPVRVRIGVLFIVLGILLFCISILCIGEIPFGDDSTEEFHLSRFNKLGFNIISSGGISFRFSIVKNSSGNAAFAN